MTTHAARPGAPADRIRAEQIALLYRAAWVGVLGALVGAFILVACLAFVGTLSAAGAACWLTVISIVALGHLLLCHRYQRARPPLGAWRRWAAAFCAFSLAEGIIWGSAVFMLTPPGAIAQQLLVTLVAIAIACGAVSAFGAYLPAFFAIFLPTVLPQTLIGALRGGGIESALSCLAVVFTGAICVIAVRANRALIEALRLRFENLDLAESLRRQKERAEQANLEKSRFLASASHDLRQPIHALSLFVGALRGCEMEQEAQQIVGHIEGSIAALDELFNALLDISRLDAGVIPVQRQAVAVQPLLERICRDHAADAVAKGVRLRLCPSRAAVDTDPVLLERILRNIVTNAVRYTDRGRVLVGCRRQGGRLRIEVWDSGRGIPAAEQTRIFEEFYQIGNPERDRSKGLGLGLAVVRRLTALLDCPLTLRSAPGAGSVFAVAVKLADGAPAAPPPPAPLLVGAARGGLILVLDDEPAIRAAMGALLAGWGHEVVAAGSCAEMLQRLAALPRRPDVIVCDWRLRGGEDGVAAVRALRQAAGAAVPAMLITGETAPEQLRRLRESGLLVLPKPVPNARLRAAIGNLMRNEAAAEPVA